MDRLIKCVVWDLDNTVWEGTLLEGDELTMRSGIRETLEELDGRGILHSIASRNDFDSAWRRLEGFGIADWFVCPEISLGAKPPALERIARRLNIGVDTLLFVDDDPLERAAVVSTLPAVRVVDAADSQTLPLRPDLTPEVVSTDARNRRKFYQAAEVRAAHEAEFDGHPDELLAALDLVYTIRRAEPDDLLRARELTLRTNQLNSTGIPYSLDELDACRVAPDSELLVMELSDRFGSYGTVGLAVVDMAVGVWRIRLLLTSCRVMSRGAGAVLLTHILQRAHDVGARCEADFVPTGHNRLIYAMFKMAGFVEASEDGGHIVLSRDGERPVLPSYQHVGDGW